VIKFLFKWIKRILLSIILLFIIIPYFIPRNGSEEIPSLPFDNSVFINTAQGISIHTRVYEPTVPIMGQIMFVHGLGGSTFSYEDNAPYLASLGYFVVSVDLPAFGFSSRQRGLVHSQPNRAMWLWDVLNQLEIIYDLGDQWNLGGHSMGGSVVLAMNNAQPNKTAGLILIDPAITGSNQRSPLLSWAVKSTPIGEWLKVFLTYRVLNENEFKTSLTGAYGIEASDRQVEAYLRPLRVKGSTQALREFFATAQGLSIYEWLYPTTPVIVIWGEDDAWIDVSNVEQIKTIAKNIQVFILENEGHNPMETNPELFNSVLVQGLRAWDSE